MQIARDLPGVFAIEQQLERLGLASDVLPVEQAPDLRLLCPERGLVRARLCAYRGEPAIDVARLPSQIAQLAVRFRDCALRLLERIRRFYLRSLGLDEPFLQRVDPAPQIVQLPLFIGTGTRRKGARTRGKQQKYANSAQGHWSVTSGLPVISGGCGKPIMARSVGATSCSAPPLAIFALRPT